MHPGPGERRAAVAVDAAADGGQGGGEGGAHAAGSHARGERPASPRSEQRTPRVRGEGVRHRAAHRGFVREAPAVHRGVRG